MYTINRGPTNAELDAIALEMDRHPRWLEPETPKRKTKKYYFCPSSDMGRVMDAYQDYKICEAWN